MQRCPYLHEMKERLLGEQQQHATIVEPQTQTHPQTQAQKEPPPTAPLSTSTTASTEQLHHDTTATNTPAHQQYPQVQPQQRPAMEPVSTVVRLNADGYSSHTSPAHQRTPLMTRHQDDDYHCVRQTSWRPKNAKTSLFIITSFIYAKLLIVICIAYVISDVVTHNLPLYYYEGFFTYLYGMSILFLLYVFCFLLQESTCCSGQENGSAPAKKAKKPPPDKKDKKEKKEKEKKEKEKKEKEKEKEKSKEKDKEKDKKNKKNVQREVFPRKMRDLVAQRATGPRATQSPTYRRNSEGAVDAAAVVVPVPVLELGTEAADVCVMSPQEVAVPVPPQAPQQPSPPPAAQQQPPPAAQQDVEAGVIVTKSVRKRKTTQNDSSHGSFFLRVGAIAFGLGTMIYNGLEFGSFFEVPFTSPCYQILRGVNPVLQMIFTFMQMYFIFMNSRLNIHRFKVVARFGLMHVVATNICVWIRTLVLEYLKEITLYHKKNQTTDEGLLGESIKSHVLRTSGSGSGASVGASASVGTDVVHALASEVPTVAGVGAASLLTSSGAAPASSSTLAAATVATLRTVATTARNATTTAATALPTTMRTALHSTTLKALPAWSALKTTLSSTEPTTTTLSPTTTTETTSAVTTTTTSTTTTPLPTTASTTTTTTTELTTFMTTTPFKKFFDFENTNNNFETAIIEVPYMDKQFEPLGTVMLLFKRENSVAGETSNIITSDTSNSILGDAASSLFHEASNSLFSNSNNNLTAILPQALTSSNDTDVLPASCGRINIMGTIVQDSAPYLFPFIIEYSLIGAAVIYVMWKHIGRNPSSRCVTEEDLEHRLEVMLSRRAVAMAQAQHGRVDCVGASKGLFFGLLLLVGSLICLILFFVLIRHPDLSLLAIYLADASHCVLMVLSIIAIIIGFIRSRHLKRSLLVYRVQGLKFRTEEQSDLNDILLRVSAFGLFTYAVFSVIAGALAAFTHEPNLLVMITGLLSIAQVVLQLLFIADVSRRRVHLPEHDRSKPGRQVVTFLLICNVTMWIIYTFETQKVEANPVQLDFYGFLAWAIVQRVTLPLCIFHRFHSAVTLAEIWKTSYKARLE